MASSDPTAKSAEEPTPSIPARKAKKIPPNLHLSKSPKKASPASRERPFTANEISESAGDSSEYASTPPIEDANQTPSSSTPNRTFPKSKSDYAKYDFKPGPNRFSPIQSSPLSSQASHSSRTITPTSTRIASLRRQSNEDPDPAFARLPPNPRSADRKAYSPTLLKRARERELPVSLPGSPKSPLPDVKEVIVETSSLLARLIGTLYLLVAYIVKIPVLVFIWMCETALENVLKVQAFFMGIVGFVFAVVDGVAGGGVNKIEAIFRGIGNFIVDLFEKPSLAPIKSIVMFGRDTARRAWSYIRAINHQATLVLFGTVGLPMIIALSFSFLFGFEILPSPLNWQPAECANGEICLSPRQQLWSGLTSLPTSLPSLQTPSLFDDVLEVGNRLVDSSDTYYQLLDLHMDSKFLQAGFQRGYRNAHAVSDKEATGRNRDVIQDLKELKAYIQKLSTATAASVDITPILEKPASELHRLHQRAGPRIKGIKTDTTLPLATALKTTADSLLENCVFLHANIGDGMPILSTFTDNLSSLAELLRVNNENAIKLRRKEWGSFTTRFARRWNPARTAERFERRQEVEERSHERAIENLKKFGVSVNRLGKELGLQGGRLVDVVEVKRKGGDEARVGRYVFRGSIEDKIRKLEGLIKRVKGRRAEGREIVARF